MMYLCNMSSSFLYLEASDKINPDPTFRDLSRKGEWKKENVLYDGDCGIRRKTNPEKSG